MTDHCAAVWIHVQLRPWRDHHHRYRNLRSVAAIHHLLIWNAYPLPHWKLLGGGRPGCSKILKSAALHIKHGIRIVLPTITDMCLKHSEAMDLYIRDEICDCKARHEGLGL